MTQDKDKFCERCGNCCRGMIWKKKFSFKEAFALTKGVANKHEVEKALTSHYIEYLGRKGIPVEKGCNVEWDRKNKRIIVLVKTMQCSHLSFNNEGKAECLNYKNRPQACRDYLCKKARERVLLGRIKEIDESAKALSAGYQKEGTYA